MTIQNITRKKPRKRNSRESSSSEETDLSKPPKDILGLGKHLVRELNFEDGVDTLGRWMSHHLAELIHESENGKTAAIRSKASQYAVNTILKIWEHRKSLPRQAYPLAEFEDLLKVIDRLRIGNNPYRYYGDGFNEVDIIASNLFDNFARLIPSLLFLKKEFLESQKKTSDAVIKSLDEKEKQILFAIQEWMTVFPSKSNDETPTKKRKKGEKQEKFDLKKNALNLIDNMTDLFTELRNELK